MGDAAAWFMKGHGVAAVYVTLALVLLAVAFVGGAVCALTCRTMKGPGLVPRAVFEDNPKRYYATVRSARKARRRGACGPECRLLLTGLAIVSVAYLAAKVLYERVY
ncbi:hypothetical protein PR202_gb20223 [Eleusine coracana subsp. coracana]|uniref:Uncharacterized protein n=1 Tax=Eleusine coracana subsp. coracana TaxID=191504 RepID=A0AAV5F7Z9_ELECO|nr:hypothetical protein PR202_gb20203 [Eleusine coracana subsp. coracana]GJN31783.1 hypothetical protein PR202_gb20223 [Eleusine coracana subsp. coracana]